MKLRRHNLISATVGTLIVVGLLVKLPKEENFPYKLPDKAPERVTQGVNFEAWDEDRFPTAWFKEEMQNRREKNLPSRGLLSPYLAVVDLNLDGYQDLVFSSKERIQILENQAGQGFRISEHSYGLDLKDDVLAGTLPDSGPILFADLTGDGILDVFVAAYDAYRFGRGEIRQGRLHFVGENWRMGSEWSVPDSVNVADINQDGRLDLIMGNFLAGPRDGDGSTAHWLTAIAYDNKTGGSDYILIQQPTGHFKVDTRFEFSSRSYTHAVGILDLNHDHFPDILLANDYAIDELYMNQKGQSLQDITGRWIPTHFHGFSGMNADIQDWNQDGWLDFYITNAYRPPVKNTRNLLWTRRPEGRFELPPKRSSIGYCGFSWGAKFSDFDLDGDLDLFVTNGRTRNLHVENPEHSPSIWFRRAMLTRMPSWLRPDEQGQHNPQHARTGRFSVSAFEEDCVFMQDVTESGERHFYDVASRAGVTARKEGRGVVLVDVDNDGLQDVLVSNFFVTPDLYINRSSKRGDWIGFELIDERGSDHPIGAKINLKFASGESSIREFYPANGYRGQSDHRLHFGVGKEVPVELEIRWPNGQVKSYRDLKINQYQSIFQSQSSKATKRQSPKPSGQVGRP